MPVNPRRLTRTEARRIAIRAQILGADRPRDLAALVDRLTFLQLDPTAVVAPTADLVAWSRLGNAYEPVHLQQALEHLPTSRDAAYRGLAAVILGLDVASLGSELRATRLGRSLPRAA